MFNTYKLTQNTSITTYNNQAKMPTAALPKPVPYRMKPKKKFVTFKGRKLFFYILALLTIAYIVLTTVDKLKKEEADASQYQLASPNEFVGIQKGKSERFEDGNVGSAKGGSGSGRGDYNDDDTYENVNGNDKVEELAPEGRKANAKVAKDQHVEKVYNTKSRKQEKEKAAAAAAAEQKGKKGRAAVDALEKGEEKLDINDVLYKGASHGRKAGAM